MMLLFRYMSVCTREPQSTDTSCLQKFLCHGLILYLSSTKANEYFTVNGCCGHCRFMSITVLQILITSSVRQQLKKPPHLILCPWLAHSAVLGGDRGGTCSCKKEEEWKKIYYLVKNHFDFSLALNSLAVSTQIASFPVSTRGHQFINVFWRKCKICYAMETGIQYTAYTTNI